MCTVHLIHIVQYIPRSHLVHSFPSVSTYTSSNTIHSAPPLFTEASPHKLSCHYITSVSSPMFSMHSPSLIGARGSAVGWGTALQVGRSRVRFPMVSLDFFIDIILLAALWPWGRLSLEQKWVPGMFPGGKWGRCVGLTTLPPSCADCLEIWEPQPPGTLRVCPGL